MRLSEKSSFQRLLGSVAVAALAVTLVACSDDKETAAAAPDTVTQTAASATTPDAATSTQTGTAANTEVAQAQTAPAPVAAEVPEADGTVDMAKVLEPGALPDMAIGDANAPVTIVEYMSTTCPHCATFHNNTFDAIKAKYVDGGKVRFIIREFPFDPRAAAAFMLARCAPEGQYFPMISMLMKQQETWAAAPNGRDALLQMSKLAGFSQESFEACLTNQKLLDDVNAVMQKGAKDFGVSSTPTFIVNGKRYAGALSVDSMSALIDSLL